LGSAGSQHFGGVPFNNTGAVWGLNLYGSSKVHHFDARFSHDFDPLCAAATYQQTPATFFGLASATGNIFGCRFCCYMFFRI
jgi:hypothetical protein